MNYTVDDGKTWKEIEESIRDVSDIHLVGEINNIKDVLSLDSFADSALYDYIMSLYVSLLDEVLKRFSKQCLGSDEEVFKSLGPILELDEFVKNAELSFEKE